MNYTFDEKKVTIIINEDENHYDVVLQALDEKMEQNIKKVRDIMEGNKDLLDVNFLAFAHNKFEVYVRKNALDDFLLQLMKYKVLTSLFH